MTPYCEFPWTEVIIINALVAIVFYTAGYLVRAIFEDNKRIERLNRSLKQKYTGGY